MFFSGLHLNCTTKTVAAASIVFFILLYIISVSAAVIVASDVADAAVAYDVSALAVDCRLLLN